MGGLHGPTFGATAKAFEYVLGSFMVLPYVVGSVRFSSMAPSIVACAGTFGVTELPGR
jgi:hypothetical protein